MRLMFYPVIFSFAFLFFVSCEKENEKELKYNKEELYSLAKEIDPNLTFVLPRTLKDGIKCSDYTPGCVAGHVVKARGLEFIAIEFGTEKQAIDAAIKYNGYYSRNWMFDDVSGEPFLEDFISLLKAKKPSEGSLKKD